MMFSDLVGIAGVLSWAELRNILTTTE